MTPQVGLHSDLEGGSEGKSPVLDFGQMASLRHVSKKDRNNLAAYILMRKF